MYSQEEMLEQCLKPEGEIGRFVGQKMNERHLPVWQWGISHITINDDDMILDVGCGGGEAIKLLSKYSTRGTIYGIDYSKEMVNLSNETNKNLIDINRVQIYEASISKLPFSDNTFNLVTAFETFSFWPDVLNDFKEVRRVLQPGGIFLLVNTAYKHELFETRNEYWNNLFNINIYSIAELNNFFSKSNLSILQIIERIENNWITIVAKKPLG